MKLFHKIKHNYSFFKKNLDYLPHKIKESDMKKIRLILVLSFFLSLPTAKAGYFKDYESYNEKGEKTSVYIYTLGAWMSFP